MEYIKIIFYIQQFQFSVRVRQFNKTKPPPDIQMEDWHLWAQGDELVHTEMGYRAMGDHVNDFLQKQVKN